MEYLPKWVGWGSTLFVIAALVVLIGLSAYNHIQTNRIRRDTETYHRTAPREADARNAAVAQTTTEAISAVVNETAQKSNDAYATQLNQQEARWNAYLNEWRSAVLVTRKFIDQPMLGNFNVLDEMAFDPDRMAVVLKDVVDTLNEHSVKYYTAYGTLLGLVRDGALIPWDRDADLSVHVTDYGLLRDVVVPKLVQRGFSLLDVSPTRPCRFLFSETWPHQHAPKCYLLLRDGQLVELALQLWLPPVELRTFASLNDLELALPQDPELYLAELYGADWNVPNAQFRSVSEKWKDPHEQRLACAMPWRHEPYYNHVMGETGDETTATSTEGTHAPGDGGQHHGASEQPQS